MAQILDSIYVYGNLREKILVEHSSVVTWKSIGENGETRKLDGENLDAERENQSTLREIVYW